MGKLPKMKNRGVSIHSRAARRAVSPSAPLIVSNDKTPVVGGMKEVKPYLLAAHSTAIRKKSKRGQLSRAQKLRQRKGAERADVHADTLDLKVQKSLGRRNTIKARRGDWDSVESNLEIETQLPPTALSQAQITKANIFRNLDVEGEKKTNELPYAYTGAKVTLPVFSGKRPPSRTVQLPRKDFEETEAND